MPATLLTSHQAGSLVIVESSSPSKVMTHHQDNSFDTLRANAGKGRGVNWVDIILSEDSLGNKMQGDTSCTLYEPSGHKCVSNCCPAAVSVVDVVSAAGGAGLCFLSWASWNLSRRSEVFAHAWWVCRETGCDVMSCDVTGDCMSCDALTLEYACHEFGILAARRSQHGSRHTTPRHAMPCDGTHGAT